MSTAAYLVEGMTCGYCMGKVNKRIRSLSGVTEVVMDLDAEGRSPLLVMSGTAVGVDVVRKAVESAGFGFVSSREPHVPQGRDDPFTQEGDSLPVRPGKLAFSIGGVSS